jgi:class I fructose-bisphosphate aldolase
MRTDTANIYGSELPDCRYSEVIANAALQAVQLDAVCVCVNLFQILGAPDVNHQLM